MKMKIFIMITAVMLLCFPKINLGQAVAPTLGTAANFAILSSAGAIKSTSILKFNTHVTGNIGGTPASFSGFGNVDGVIHEGTPKFSAAVADLLSAYTDLNTPTSETVLSTPFGAGNTLISGVYKINSASTLTGELILDGQNNPNAVFIFKLEGAFATDPNAKVKLINGALACNVFWKVETSINMAAGTSMKGTLIANAGAVMMGVQDTLEGRIFAINGAITMNETVVYLPKGCGSPVLTGPAAPTLGKVACYALFSSMGPLADDFASYINNGADIGNNGGGTVTNFDPLKLTGATVTSDALCASNLLDAYNYLNGLALADTILLREPTLFGHNLVLTPHTYNMNAAVELNDTLYFNAEGNPDAIFVININNGAAFEAKPNANIVLLNGAQAMNIFWKIDGAVLMGTNVNFKGTILSAAAIDIGTGTFLEGRILTTVGSITTAAVTVNITPGCGIPATNIITEPVNQIACVGDSVGFVVKAVGTGIAYQWRKGTVNLTNGGRFSGVNNDTLIIDPSNSSDLAANYNVVIIGSPNDTSVNVSLTFNASPVITSEPVDTAVCSGSSASFSVVATGPGLTYRWRKGNVNLNNGGNISGADQATLTINPATITDAANNYNVVVTGSCLPNDTSINVALSMGSAAPVITTQPANETVCEGTSASFTVVSPGLGLTYKWRKGNVDLVNNASVTGVATASLTINPTSAADAALNYNVIVYGTCASDTSDDASLTVNPIPAVNNIADVVACNTSATAAIIFTGSGTTYNWTNDNIATGLAANGSGDIASFTATNAGSTAIVSTVTVIPTAAGCPGPAKTFTITVNPTPTVNAVANQTVCNNAPTAAIIYSGAVAGTTYNWTNTNATIGLDANGAGDILSFTAVNTGNTAVVSTITATPVANGCTGSAVTFTITVNPTPTVDASANQAVCNNATTTAITFTGSAGATFNWTNDNATTGLAASGSGDIASFTATNTGSTAVVSTITATPTAAGCAGAASTFTITVNPTPIANSMVNLTFCTNTISSAIALTANVAGSTSTWTNDNTATGLAASGNGDIASFTTSNTVSTSTITFTPTANGCIGANASFTITVVSRPTAVASSNSPVWTGNALNLNASTVAAGTYSWTGPNGYTSADQNSVISPAALANNGTYTLIVSSNGCNSLPVDLVVIVKNQLHIPEGFSPNTDGINDLFVIRGIENYPANTFTIFSRWGSKLSTTSPYKNEWDGKSKSGVTIGGDELPAGTYFYVLDLGDGSKILKGTIYLNR